MTLSRLTTILLLALFATALPAQSCSVTGSSQTNFGQWQNNFADAGELLLQRAFSVVNNEPYPIRISSVQFPLSESCVVTQTVDVSLHRANGAGNPGTQVGLTSTLTVPNSPSLVAATFGGAAVLQPGDPYLVVINYGSACLFGSVKGPIASIGNLVSSRIQTQQSGVTFWLQDDERIIHRMNYGPELRGRFDIYGAGCSGLTNVPCSTSPLQSRNFGSFSANQILSGGQWAIKVQDTFGYPTRDLCSVELEMSAAGASPVEVLISIYDDANNDPDQVLATTSIMVPPGPPAARTVSFPSPVRISAGTNYWIGLEPLGPVVGPVAQFGQPVTHALNTPGVGWTTSNQWSWAYRTFVTASPLPAVPAITGTSPKIGQSSVLRLLYGPSNSLATLVVGTGNPDLDLSPFGAPGCRLLVSLDQIAQLPTDSQGRVILPYTLPCDPQLVGLTLNAQFFVPSAQNPLGVIASPAARLRVGSF